MLSIHARDADRASSNSNVDSSEASLMSAISEARAFNESVAEAIVNIGASVTQGENQILSERAVAISAIILARDAAIAQIGLSSQNGLNRPAQHNQTVPRPAQKLPTE